MSFIGGEDGNKLGNAYVDLGVNLSPLNMGLAAGLLALESYFVAAYAKMDTAMRNIWTISNISESELRTIQSDIQALSRELPQSAAQLAAGYYNVVSSGVEAGDAMYVLEVAAKAASASLTDTDTAVRGITYLLNAYSLDAKEAGRVSDMMFKAVDKGVFTFGELADSVGRYASTAAAAKVPLEQVIAAQASISKTGLSAAEASTAVNAVLQGFIKPSEEMAGWAKEMGYESAAAALETLGLAEALERISLATGGAIEKIALFFPNIRGIKGELALTRGEGADYVEVLDTITNSVGATDRAFAKQKDSLETSSQLLKNAVNEAAVKLGESAEPAYKAIAEGITGILNAFSELSPEAIAIVNATAGIAAITGAFSILESIVPKVMALMGSGGGGILSLFTAANPIGWVVLGGIAAAAITDVVVKMQDWEGAAKKGAEANDSALRSLMTLSEANFADIQDLTNLIGVYEEYASKATLTAEEQKKLNEVINGIESIAPGVVTSWDNMGNAMSINIGSAKQELENLWSIQLTYAEGVKELADMQYANSKDAREKLLSEKNVLNEQLELFRKVEGLNAKINYDDSWEKRRVSAVQAINKGQIKNFDQLAEFMGKDWGKVTEQLMAVKELINSGTGDWWKLQGASLNETLARITEWSTKDLTKKQEDDATKRLMEIQNSLNIFNDYATKAAEAAKEVNNLVEAIEKLRKSTEGLEPKKIGSISITPNTTGIGPSPLFQTAGISGIGTDFGGSLVNQVFNELPGSLRRVDESLSGLSDNLGILDQSMGAELDQFGRPTYLRDITGPMGDILEALNPLKELQALRGYTDEIVSAVMSVRDAVMAAGAEIASATTSNENTVLGYIKAIEREARMAEVGMGG